MSGRLASRIATGLLVVAGIVVAVIACELVTRAVGVRPTLSIEWYLMPSARDIRVANQDIIIINPAFLDPDFYEVDETRPTIVTIGDSFTESIPVDPRDGYPAVLDDILHRSGWPVNLIDVGLSVSGTDQHLRLFKEYVLPRVKPDVVVWQLYANDIEDNILFAVYDISNGALEPASYHWMYIRQTINDALPIPDSIKQDSPVLFFLFRALEIVGRGLTPGSSKDYQIEWSETKLQLAVEEMDRLAEEHGFEIYYLLVKPQVFYLEPGPVRDESRNRTWAEHHERIRAIVQPKPNFIEAWFGADEAGEAEGDGAPDAGSVPSEGALFVGADRDTNRVGDRHFTERGYRMLAELVAQRLLEDRK